MGEALETSRPFHAPALSGTRPPASSLHRHLAGFVSSWVSRALGRCPSRKTKSKMNSVVLHASALLATPHSPLPPHRSRASSPAFCSQTGHAGIRLTLFVSSLRFLCARRLPRPGRGVSALSFSVSAGVLPYVYLAATSPPFPYFLTSLLPYLLFSSSRPAFCLQLGYASIGLTLFPMDFSLKDHQKLIPDTVRQFLEADVRT